jgi:outer membrane protein assembly factor BamB
MANRRRARRRGLLIILSLAGILAVAGTAAVLIILQVMRQSEDDLYQLAVGEYDQGRYAKAAGDFQNIVDKFSDSDKLPRYQFLIELCQVRDKVYSAQDDVEVDASSNKLDRFIEDRKVDPLLKEYLEDVRHTLLKLAGHMAKLAAEKFSEEWLKRAEKAFADNLRFKDPGARGEADEKLVAAEIDQAREGIAEKHRHEAILAHVGDMVKEKPTPLQVTRVKEYLRQQKVDKDAQALELLGQLEQAVRAQVKYVPDPAASETVVADTSEPSLLVVPRIYGPEEKAQHRRVVLALVNGVLYGLDLHNGEAQWYTRVGIDTSTLPVRLAATSVSPELFLVLSADRNLLMALAALDGRLLWQYRLESPCLGRPVVVGKYAYVSTDDGKVHELEIVQGTRLGYFDLGQPLTVGGVWLEGTDLLYVPANSDNLYILDIALHQKLGEPERPKQCVGILPTGHPSGSLRSEPFIITRKDPFAQDAAGQNAWPPFLILSQTDGPNHIVLRVFALVSEGLPQALTPDQRLRGWSWFRPYHDDEKVALVTDASVFGLFGICLPHNDDRPLFALLEKEQPLGSSPGTTVNPAAVPLRRAQVVHAVENDFWVAANGTLQRLHVDLFGQALTSLWTTPFLGTPVHAGQWEENDRTNEKTLVLVTQDPSRQIHIASAVDAESGHLRWQRRIGLAAQGDPLVLGDEALLVERGGGLLAVRLDQHGLVGTTGQKWREIDPVVRGSLEIPPDKGEMVSTYLLAAADGKTAYELAGPNHGKRLTVRRYQLPPEGQPAVIQEKAVDLPAALSGTPALLGSDVILPLSDRTLMRVGLAADAGPGVGGPNWRSGRAADDALGHVVAIGDDEFLTTDGSNGLTHRQWKQGVFRTIPEERPITVELSARIVAPPVVLPRANPSDDLQVVVADSLGALTLLKGPELKPVQNWRFAGPITAGPFLRGQRVAYVVNKTHLVWIDPGQAEALWDYPAQGDIVGQPQLVHGQVVVADLSGRIVALETEHGKAQSKGYLLRNGAAAVTTPVGFGPNQVMVALTDGTIVLVPWSRLSASVQNFPVIVPH